MALTHAGLGGRVVLIVPVWPGGSVGQRGPNNNPLSRPPMLPGVSSLQPLCASSTVSSSPSQGRF